MQVLRHLKTQMFMPGDYVVRAGDMGDSMYFIRSGLCKILIPVAAGAMPASDKDASKPSFFEDVTTSKGQVCHLLDHWNTQCG